MGPEPGVGVRCEEDLKNALIPPTLVIVLNPPSLRDHPWLSNNSPPFVVTQRASKSGASGFCYRASEFRF